ncbi:MAG: hypothetical protein HC875_27950 [Anaerolineales bacterium]|nr:hypothetical protein [Anaerolineales bacterium]
MLADAQMLEKIFNQVTQLSPEYRLRLVQRIIQTLISPPVSQQPHPLRFGEFRGNEAAMSTFEDFAIAEWRPADKELDGP